MKPTINVTEIENGWLVATPPTDGEMRAAQVSQRQVQGKIVYCEDYESVCAALKPNFPPK